MCVCVWERERERERERDRERKAKSIFRKKSICHKLWNIWSRSQSISHQIVVSVWTTQILVWLDKKVRIKWLMNLLIWTHCLVELNTFFGIKHYPSLGIKTHTHTHTQTLYCMYIEMHTHLQQPMSDRCTCQWLVQPGSEHLVSLCSSQAPRVCVRVCVCV